MQRLEVSGAIRPIYGSLGVKRLMSYTEDGGSMPLRNVDAYTNLHVITLKYP